MAKHSKAAKSHHSSHPHALLQIREAIGMKQGTFASLIGVSAPYIQAVENGYRPASAELAEKVRDRTGAWPTCIVENWPNPVDVEGKPYTAEFFKSLTVPKVDTVETEKELQDLLQPLSIILRGAGKVGKSVLALSLVRDKLHEAATRILALDGVSDVIANDRQEAGQLTVGQLRRNPEMAKQVNFRDDGTRKDEEAVVLHFKPRSDFHAGNLLTNFVSVCHAANRGGSSTTTPNPSQKGSGARVSRGRARS